MCGLMLEIVRPKLKFSLVPSSNLLSSPVEFEESCMITDATQPERWYVLILVIKYE